MSAIIGITTYRNLDEGGYYLPDGYVESVRLAGGVPFLLTPGETEIDTILQAVDAIVFAGGGDIDPELYKGPSHPSIDRVDPVRDAFELSLAKRLFHLNTPVLGICRGFQLLAVASGSKLITHIPEEIGEKVKHMAADGNAVRHVVQVEPQSRLSKITESTEFGVESKHHQAVRDVSNDWQIVARSEDGLIEALEYKKHPWLISVLWHPEMSLQDPYHQNIFRALVRAIGK